eukprot:CAMPEP_0198646158 /NCGR_PEP_ID=MMETSP1467-20131203/1695_1 /TAXON_ID=1462469 /ORGANISM="unid. sp., Strain CCMP2135" /LENGTH=60 /DNA_ID=CAMNT_0044381671 /DNA_START=113 /DNA_END=291 /DNA_ORIENTATION=-
MTLRGLSLTTGQTHAHADHANTHVADEEVPSVARGPGLAAGAVKGLEEEAHRRRHLRLRL